MKETINEVLQRYKNDYTDYEIYRFTEPAMYYSGNIHTDTIQYLGDELSVDYDKTFNLDSQLMDEEDYNNSVLANTGERFADMYEPEDKVLVIVLLDAHIIEDTVYNQEEWEQLS